jgi:hypothetical protein
MHGRHFLYALKISPSWSERHQPESGSLSKHAKQEKAKSNMKNLTPKKIQLSADALDANETSSKIAHLCVGGCYSWMQRQQRKCHISITFPELQISKPVVKTIRRRPKASIMDHPDVSYKVVHRNGGCTTAPEEIKALKIHCEFKFPKRYSWSTEHSRSKSSSHNLQRDRKIK